MKPRISKIDDTELEEAENFILNFKLNPNDFRTPSPKCHINLDDPFMYETTELEQFSSINGKQDVVFSQLDFEERLKMEELEKKKNLVIS